MRSVPFGRRTGDEGFTLIEVLVSLAVLSTAMAGLGAFYVNGSLAVAQQRDQRQAAQVASGTLEQVRALEGSALLDGRGEAKVKAQWQEVQAGPFKDKVTPYLDTMATPFDAAQGEYAYDASAVDKGDNAPLPTAIQRISTGGMAFEQRLLVSGCEVYPLAAKDEEKDDCVRPLPIGDPKRPTDTTSILKYYRIVVVVSWPHKSCPANQCAYVVSTLVSRVKDDAVFSDKRPTPLIRMPLMQTFYRGRSGVTVYMKATGGNLPNTWSATNLPDGLRIDPVTGEVSGTPTKTGKWSFATTNTAIKVTESTPPAGASLRSDTDADLNLVWEVVDPPTVTVPVDPASRSGDAVRIQPVVTGGVGPFTYQVEAPLPTGLVIDAKTGLITGTAAQTFTTTIVATDANGMSGKLTHTHTVLDPLTVQAIPPQRIAVSSTLTLAMAAAGGDGKYTYAASGLPVGSVINPSTGVISGSPVLIAGRYLPTVTVTDGRGSTVSTTFELLVTSASGLAVTSPAGQVDSVVGQEVTLPVTTNADTVGAQGVKITAVGLPAGTSWQNGNEAISGTPLLAGTYTVALTAVSSHPVETVIHTFVWRVS
ncbi:putative Ig domain-containing protein [Actinoplanes flavus]|uniref:Ig domain-containing protein n=1 Tax=Actinoplanes flavus TaxID=2820290 RepID=A0ABS3UAX7_9ACTN|nr:putative Ig domain-containing protein [Actinoplanes flavus]MBO3735907.1 putative Ig domain-containing protein [Actinoplanes flavus]